MSDQAKGSDRHLDLVSMGCRWVLDLSELDATAAGEVAARWGRCAELASSATLVLDEEPVTIAATPSKAPYDLSRELTRAGLMRLRGRVTLLHAAALADPTGRTLALVAPSGGGKSTATRVLGQHLGYVSDETVVLLPDHRIAPHPKPPSLVVDPADRWRKHEPSPDELGLGPTPTEPRLARLLTLSRDDAVLEPTIEPVGLIDQVLAILPETSSTWLVPGGLDHLARAATAGGPPARLRYAEADTCHDLVREHLAAPATPAPTWQHLPPPEPHDPGGMRTSSHDPREMRTSSHDPGEMRLAELGAGARVVRAPWSDAVAHEGEVLVLAGPSPLRLAGPGAVIWLAADTERTIDELTEAVVAELGEHLDAAGLVRAATVELLRHGALQHALA